MPVFEYVLILLAAVLLSNLVNRFVPALSAPIVQIILGFMITLIPFGPFGFEFRLEPDLFFVLFLSPLVFSSSMNADKRTMWELKGPIISSAVLLVFITVIAVGYLLNLLVPVIPLAAAFALIASLGPTDDVAVAAVSQRVTVPRRVMNILTGESIINDASGIVSFQFAVAAITTGAFSFSNAAGYFLLVGLGGITAGIILTWLKNLLVKWLRTLGIVNVTLHILVDILTPFIIYMSAEALHVSGILAVFTSGIAHSIMRDKFNPETVKLAVAQESVWQTLSFTFEGMVFVMLGTQLPEIIKTIRDNRFSIAGWEIAFCIISLTVIFAVIRFVWWILVIRKKTYQEPDKPVGKIRAGLIFALSGARGTVTLASVMSIPLLLSDGSVFPQRDLLIILAGGVIVISMLITNFVLPLFVKTKNEEARNEMEREAYMKIIQGVISVLSSEVTDENRIATRKVIRSYEDRNASLKDRKTVQHEMDSVRELLTLTFTWGREKTLAMIDEGSVDGAAAKRFLEVMDNQIEINLYRKNRNFFRKNLRFMKHIFRNVRHRGGHSYRENLRAIREENTRYILDKLRYLRNEENSAAIDRVIYLYEMLPAIHQIRSDIREKPEPGTQRDNHVFEVAARGFQVERGLIQEMFEQGRISWGMAKEMRGNIATLEARLYDE